MSIGLKKYLKIINKIQVVLTPDLLSKKWSGNHMSSVTGHCYCASEALYYLIGQKNGFYPMVLSHKTWPSGLLKGETHWFLMNNQKQILDPTKEQFNCKIKYHLARKCGFLTNKPSKRCKIIIERVLNGKNNSKRTIYDQ